MYLADKVNLINKGRKFAEQYMKRNNWTLVYFDESTMTAEYSKTAAGVTLKKAYIVFTKNWRVKEVQ